MAVLHGGQLARVAKQYQIPEQQWCDLSTGIAPYSYPIPDIPDKHWQELPCISDSLIKVAKRYYNAEHCWPLAGSQQLIEKLPSLWNEQVGLQSPKHVYLPKVGYKEHQQAWSKAGYQLHLYQKKLPSEIEINSVVVVINPNNPLTDIFSIKQLMILKDQCKQQQALLIIDEAFADVFSPEFSFAPHINFDAEDVVVLRSFGKFFGLAGLRIGFVCSTKKWCDVVKRAIGPWSVNGPALYITEVALNDTQWQTAQRLRLEKQCQQMQALLLQYLPVICIKSNALFMMVYVEDAPSIYDALCKQAVYVRLTDENDALRFGIADALQLKCLAEKLACIGVTT